MINFLKPELPEDMNIKVLQQAGSYSVMKVFEKYFNASVFVFNYQFALPESVTLFEETLVFELIQLIGNLGGTFSLFTGFSFAGFVAWILMVIQKKIIAIMKSLCLD